MLCYSSASSLYCLTFAIISHSLPRRDGEAYFIMCATFMNGTEGNVNMTPLLNHLLMHMEYQLITLYEANLTLHCYKRF